MTGNNILARTIVSSGSKTHINFSNYPFFSENTSRIEYAKSSKAFKKLDATAGRNHAFERGIIAQMSARNKVHKC
jgi:hypothetical protein